MQFLRMGILVLFCGLFANSLLAQNFDERMSDWPLDLKINGTILASGGGDPDEYMRDGFWQLAGGEKAKIVEIVYDDSNVHGEEESEEKQDTDDPLKSGASYSMFCWADKSDVKIRDQLAGATGVWLQADDKLNRNQRKQIRALVDNLKQVVDRRGVIFAGPGIARMLGRHEIVGGQLAGNQKHASIIDGLNLIPDAIISTGFEDSNRRPQVLSVLGSHPRNIGIGIEKDTMIRFTGRKIRAIGDGSATFLMMANERSPLRVKTIRQPPARRADPYRHLVDLTAWRRDAIDRTLKPFPPAKPKSPLVENGTLLIVGGGGLPDGLMDKFMEIAGGKQAKLVYVPCTERESISVRNNRLVDAWKERVASAHVLHTKNRTQANSDESFLKPLEDATGIWFGGGRQWNFSDSYYGTRAHKLMKQVLQRGGVIGGSSAGASIQARYLARANPLGNIDIMAPGYERGGLGFISGIAIDQHFSQRGRQADMTQLVNRYPQLLGIGIDEGTALVVQKSIAEVVGKGQVFFYDRDQQKAWDNPDYLALSAGSKYDLASRRVIGAAAETDEEDNDKN